MASDRDHGFGWSIDISGDTLIAGSWMDGPFVYWDQDTNSMVTLNQTQGSARVFVRTNPDSNVDWEQQGDELIVDDGEGGSYYGYRVAIDGDTALVSVTNSDTHWARLFIFERSNGAWEQTKMLHTAIDSYGGIVLHIALEGSTGEISL
jgi:hypothetical protein